jgi:hypothetical protein
VTARLPSQETQSKHTNPLTSIQPEALPLEASAKRPGRTEIACRKQVEPFRQSSFDFWCGPYAVINAINLAMAENGGLRTRKGAMLYRATADYLHRRDGLADAMVTGISTQRVFALARLYAQLLTDFRWKVRVERPDRSALLSIDDLIGWIRNSIDLGMPVVLKLMGDFSHWSCIAAIDGSRIYLFDSGCLKSVRLKDCKVKAGAVNISPARMLRVRVERRQPGDMEGYPRGITLSIGELCGG